MQQKQVSKMQLAKNFDLASLKSEGDKLDIDKLEKVLTGLNSLRSKVDKLNADKLVPVSVELKKAKWCSRKMMLLKRCCYVSNARNKNIEDKLPDITNVVKLLLMLKKMRLKTKYLILLT